MLREEVLQEIIGGFFRSFFFFILCGSVLFQSRTMNNFIAHIRNKNSLKNKDPK